MGGIGPGPFCGMLLADMGAEILRIERPFATDPVAIPEPYDLLHRGRPSLRIDLKSAIGVDAVLKLCETADALFEGFRPGVMEQLGLGPDECRAVNPKLVYGRITGWGQDGPLASTAGHDGNYASLAGAIGAIGPRSGAPSVPLNLIADFGGGGAYLAIGLLAAMLEAHKSGQGQVVDAAMVDGSASLMTLFYGLHAAGLWKDERNSNLLDGAAPFYRPYWTSDDRYVFVAAIEPKFFALLLEKTGVAGIHRAEQFDQSKWSSQSAMLAAEFATKTRAEWESVFEGTDGCVTPVLSLTEAPGHPHNRARETFVEVDEVVQPAPAPRFSRTKSEIRARPAEQRAAVRELLANWGIAEEELPGVLWPESGEPSSP